MQRGNVVLAGILTLTMGLTACSSSGSELTSNTHLTIAVKRDQPSLGKSSVGSDYDGFEVKLARAFNEEFGTGSDYAPRGVTSSDRDIVLGTAADPGLADVVIATYSITPNRLENYAMIGPYLKSDLGVLVREDDESITHLHELQTRKEPVCTAGGESTSPTTSEKVLNNPDIGITPSSKENFSTCVEGLTKGTYSAVVTDEIILRGFAKDPEYKDDVKVVENFTSVGDTNYYGIAIRRGNDELCGDIMTWLKDYVVGNEWDDSFRNAFGELDRGEYKPSIRDIEGNSCRSKPSER